MTIREIAKLAGVSTASVSRAINNETGISENTRKRILEIVTKVDYQPNILAKGLSQQKTYTIGIAIPDMSNVFYADVLKGVEDIAELYNYTVMYFNTYYNSEKERKVLEFLNNERVDGLLGYMSNHVIDECVNTVHRKRPFVLLGQVMDEVECPQIGCNNISSAYEINEYLIKKGHKKIAHLAGSWETKTGIQRLQGYKKAMENYGLPIEDGWVIETDYTNADAYPKIYDFLSKTSDVTAIFAANDAMAAACYQAIYDMGLKIPEDISVVGHDDTETARLLYPNLTTMRQEKQKIGRTATNKLFGIMENRIFAKEVVTIPTKLIERDSVATCI